METRKVSARGFRQSPAYNNANILGGLFSAVKDADTPKETWKARFVVRGSRVNIEASIVHDNSNNRAQAVRMFVGTATNLMFKKFVLEIEVLGRTRVLRC